MSIPKRPLEGPCHINRTAPALHGFGPSGRSSNILLHYFNEQFTNCQEILTAAPKKYMITVQSYPAKVPKRTRAGQDAHQRGPPPGFGARCKRLCAACLTYHRRARGRTPAGPGPLQPKTSGAFFKGAIRVEPWSRMLHPVCFATGWGVFSFTGGLRR